MDKSGYTLLPNRTDHKCFGCGPANPAGLQMQFYTNGETVASWITVPPHLCGWSNLAHGGILFTALDEIMGRTMIYLLQRFVLTKSITIEYLKPVPLGREFKVEGRILEVRSEREAAAEGIITNDEGEICTRATGLWATFTPSRPESSALPTRRPSAGSSRSSRRNVEAREKGIGRQGKALAAFPSHNVLSCAFSALT